MPSQRFIFDGIALIANLAGHLGQVKSFAPGRTGNMEYTADYCGEPIFTNLVSRQVEEQHEPLPSYPMSDQVQDERESPLPGAILNCISKPLTLVLVSDHAQEERVESFLSLMSDRASKPLSLSPASD